MKEKAVVIDIHTNGSQHEVINSSLLIMILNDYKNIEYYAKISAINNIRKILNELDIEYNNVLFKPIKQYKIESSKKIMRPINELIATIYLIMIFLSVRGKRDVFFNYNLNLAILPISLLLFLLNKVYVYDICHNEMELFLSKEKIEGPISKIFRLNYKLCFSYLELNKRLHLILLGDYMLNNIKSLIKKDNYKNFSTIDHAYIRPNRVMNNYDKIKETKLKIGIPCFLTDKRGLKELNYLLRKLTNIDRISLYTLSQIDGNIARTSILKTLNKNNSLMPFELYAGYCQQMDYFLILYQTNTYKMTASGSVLEAIWQCKPIISLGNEYVRYITEKYGEIGFVCETVDEIVELLNNPVKLNNNKDMFIKRMRCVKEKISPFSLKEAFNSITIHG